MGTATQTHANANGLAAHPVADHGTTPKRGRGGAKTKSKRGGAKQKTRGKTARGRTKARGAKTRGRTQKAAGRRPGRPRKQEAAQQVVDNVITDRPTLMREDWMSIEQNLLGVAKPLQVFAGNYFDLIGASQTLKQAVEAAVILEGAINDTGIALRATR